MPPPPIMPMEPMLPSLPPRSMGGRISSSSSSSGLPCAKRGGGRRRRLPSSSPSSPIRKTGGVRGATGRSLASSRVLSAVTVERSSVTCVRKLSKAARVSGTQGKPAEVEDGGTTTTVSGAADTLNTLGGSKVGATGAASWSGDGRGRIRGGRRGPPVLASPPRGIWGRVSPSRSGGIGGRVSPSRRGGQGGNPSGGGPGGRTTGGLSAVSSEVWARAMLTLTCHKQNAATQTIQVQRSIRCERIRYSSTSSINTALQVLPNHDQYIT